METDLSLIRKRRAQRAGVQSLSKTATPTPPEIIDIGSLESSALMAVSIPGAIISGELQADGDTDMLDLGSAQIGDDLFGDGLMEEEALQKANAAQTSEVVDPAGDKVTDVNQIALTGIENPLKVMQEKTAADGGGQPAGDDFVCDLDSLFKGPGAASANLDTTANDTELDLSFPLEDLSSVDNTNTLAVGTFENMDLTGTDLTNGVSGGEAPNAEMPGFSDLLDAPNDFQAQPAGTEGAATIGEVAQTAEADFSNLRADGDEGQTSFEDLFADIGGGDIGGGDINFDDFDWNTPA